MRKVLFSKWIPTQYTHLDGTTTDKCEPYPDGSDRRNNNNIPIPGKYTEDNEGYFHQWGCAYEEFESGPGNYSVALVEDGCGNIHEILPSKIKFLDHE
jgi:hypothetical protein